jgi:uncharacterized protein (TIGR02421 family)
MAAAQPDTITHDLIDRICTRLVENKRVQQVLPDGGRLHVERQVPFLCIYRMPARNPADQTARLITGEASYLIAPTSRQHHQMLSLLVSRVVATLADIFDAFLLVEIWSSYAPLHITGEPTDEQLSRPTFRILAQTSPNDPILPTLAQLEKSLKRLHIAQQYATVEVLSARKTTPPGAGPLLTSKEARSVGCRMIGLEVVPVYYDKTGTILYPMVLQTLHHGMARALKHTFFTFVRTHTTQRPAHYHVLGRHAVVKAVWEVDQQLATISNASDFLLLVTPINSDEAWATFKRRNGQQTPVFTYRPLPIDPVLLKRTLYNIRIERVEDPSLFRLFYEKQRELDIQLSMLLERGSPNFLYGSLQLFGKVDDSLLETARDLLRRLSPRSRDDSHGGYWDAYRFARRAEEEIAYYRQSYPPLSAKVAVRDDITSSGLMVSQGNLLIGRQTRVPVRRVEPLLHHEIGTHVLTYFNGYSQPLQQLYTGLAGYDELQEGLAVLAEYLGGNLSRPRVRLLAARVVAAHMLADGASFVETYRELDTTYQFDQRTAFTITMRIYRGGGLTKDAIYLRGLLAVLDYVQRGGELAPLFVGKIAASHIPLVRELQLRTILHPAPMQPRYMQEPSTAARLERLRQGVTVSDLVERKNL